MCTCKDRIPAPRPAVIPEHFLMLLEAEELTAEPVVGQATGIGYRYDVRRRLYVDSRDAVYILGPGFRILEDV